jgi:hypothetical protein
MCVCPSVTNFRRSFLSHYSSQVLEILWNYVDLRLFDSFIPNVRLFLTLTMDYYVYIIKIEGSLKRDRSKGDAYSSQDPTSGIPKSLCLPKILNYISHRS